MDNRENIPAVSPENPTPPKKTGGLYKNLKVSVRTMNIVITVGIAALVICLIILINNNGFTVTFDTDGGSHVETQKLMHGDKVTVEEDPVKEGYVFKGWYIDKNCIYEWDMENDTVTDSMTLYAGWIKKAD